MFSQEEVLTAFAEKISKSIIRKTIADLQKMPYTQSGDDTVLENVWDEMCVQQQFELSFFWSAYVETAKRVINNHVSDLEKHEMLALWFQTDEGGEWESEYEGLVEDQHREDDLYGCRREDLWEWVWSERDKMRKDGLPLENDTIVSHLFDTLCIKAAQWSNKRIRKYGDKHW